MSPTRLRPRFFISAVEEEFSTLRTGVEELIASLGYDCETMSISGTEIGDLRMALRNKIDGCDGLIQIVGDGYGPEPRDMFPSIERVSYTQFEFRYAQARSKSLWLLFAGSNVQRDRPVGELDLPREPDHADALRYQAERRKLQASYRHNLGLEGIESVRFDSAIELENAILKLNHRAKELRENLHLWKNAPPPATDPQARKPQMKATPAATAKVSRPPINRAVPLTAAGVVIAGLIGGLVLNSMQGGHPSTATVAAEDPPPPAATDGHDLIAAKRRNRANDAYVLGKRTLLDTPNLPDLRSSFEDLDRLHTATLDAVERLRTDGRGYPDYEEIRNLDELVADQPVEALRYAKSHWQKLLETATGEVGTARHPKTLMAYCRIVRDNGDYPLAAEMLKATVETLPEWTEAHGLYWDLLFKSAGPRAERSGLVPQARDFYKLAVPEAEALAQAHDWDTRDSAKALSDSRDALEKLEHQIDAREDQNRLRGMTAAFKKASDADTLEDWDAFLATYADTDLKTSEEDDRMLRVARGHSDALHSKIEKAAKMAAKSNAPPAKKSDFPLRSQFAKATADLAKVNQDIEGDRKIYDDNLYIINIITDNKRVPVTQGSAQYWKCQAASQKIQAVEARAPGLKEKKNKLTEDLKQMQKAMDAASIPQ